MSAIERPPHRAGPIRVLQCMISGKCVKFLDDASKLGHLRIRRDAIGERNIQKAQPRSLDDLFFCVSTFGWTA